MPAAVPEEWSGRAVSYDGRATSCVVDEDAVDTRHSANGVHSRVAHDIDAAARRTDPSDIVRCPSTGHARAPPAREGSLRKADSVLGRDAAAPISITPTRRHGHRYATRKCAIAAAALCVFVIGGIVGSAATALVSPSCV